MVSKIQRMSRRIIAASATTILVLGAVGITLAHATSPNQTYTGCLKLGLVFNVAIGASPAFACPSGTTKITWNQTGPVGANGAKGTDGTNGTDGTDGTDGKSAYEIWLGLGNTGTVEEFITSLRGPAGTSGTNGTNGTNGVSVSSSSVAPGDANCPDGGSRFTSVSGSTFACNWAPGAAGGVAGQSGTSAVRYRRCHDHSDHRLHARSRPFGDDRCSRRLVPVRDHDWRRAGDIRTRRPGSLPSTSFSRSTAA